MQKSWQQYSETSIAETKLKNLNETVLSGDRDGITPSNGNSSSDSSHSSSTDQTLQQSLTSSSDFINLMESSVGL